MTNHLRRDNSFLKEYLNKLYMKNFASETIRRYRSVLEEFLESLRERNVTVVTAVSNDVTFFLDRLRSRELDPVTINVALGTIKSFYGYLESQFIVEENITKGIRRLPEPEKPVSYIPSHQMKEVMDEIEKSNFLTITDVSIFELFYGTGIRTSELCELKMCDLDLKDQLLVIRSDNKWNERVVPVPDLTAWVLKRYLQYREHVHFTKPWLFVTRRGKKFIRSSIYKLVRFILAPTSSKQKGANALRNSYAKHLVERGVNVQSIKNLLGHRNLHSSQRYAEPDAETLKRVYLAAHPKA